jgi:hypothetical protein
VRIPSALLGLGLAGAALSASAQIYDGSVAGYCQYIAPPGGDQPFNLTTPIPAGRTVNVDVVMSGNVTLSGVDDLSHDAYTIVGGGVDGAFTGHDRARLDHGMGIRVRDLRVDERRVRWRCRRRLGR